MMSNPGAGGWVGVGLVGEWVGEWATGLTPGEGDGRHSSHLLTGQYRCDKNGICLLQSYSLRPAC